MQSQSYFDDIHLHIINELSKAKASILIAVAWFTDRELLALLCDKASEGVKVELMLTKDKINEKVFEEFDRLVLCGGVVTFVGGQKSGRTIMHNKFCVIDGETIINGSYNWSRQARQNHENIVVSTGDPQFARQFFEEFENIKFRQTGKGALGDPGRIMARLEALRHVVALEDEDDINLQMIKLKKLIPEGPGFDAEQEIITEIVNNNFETASSLIEDYCRTRKQIAVYIDPEIGELRLELKALEIQVSTLEAENQELEHTLHAFQYRHSIELGELLRKILLLRQEHLRKETKLQPEKEDEYKEAQKDYQEFEEDYRSSREKVVASLLPEEQQELKSIFKASVKLCHSDLVTAEHKKEATKFYIKVVEAYKGNDLAAIRELYENLQHGSFAVASETLNDLQRLHSQIVRMRAAATILAKQIRSLRDSVVIGRWQKLTIGMVTIRPQSSSCRMNWPGWRERYEREEQGACSPWEECSCHRGETTTAYR